MNVLCRLTNDCWICYAPTFTPLNLCWYCSKNLPKPQPVDVRKELNLPFPAYALWPWSSTKNLWVNEFVHNQKYKAYRPIHNYLAQLWITHLLSSNVLNKNRLPDFLVPAPARLGQKDNHALSLAKGLANHLPLPLRTMFEEVSDYQRGLSRSARHNKKLSVGLGEPERLMGKSALFIDDVITTGGTARAAYLALKLPENFQAWALFYRRPSR